MAVDLYYVVQNIGGDGRGLAGELYAVQDADVVRYWETDATGDMGDGFCLLEMSRDEGGEGWIATGGDGPWTELGEMPFAGPKGGLRALFPSSEYHLVQVEA